MRCHLKKYRQIDKRTLCLILAMPRRVSLVNDLSFINNYPRAENFVQQVLIHGEGIPLVPDSFSVFYHGELGHFLAEIEENVNVTPRVALRGYAAAEYYDTLDVGDCLAYINHFRYFGLLGRENPVDVLERFGHSVP